MSTTSVQSRSIDGFAAITLENASLELTVVPSLGARLVSLQSKAGGRREWMWRPDDSRGLFSSPPDALFENGPLAGADECLPTILPCELDGRGIPDHGEVWGRSWNFEVEADHALVTSIALRSLPLFFHRRVTLEGNVVRLDYTLTNTSGAAVQYLWAFHPMFTWKIGDQIVLNGTSEVLIAGTQESLLTAGDRGPWPSPRPGFRLDRGEIGAPVNSYCKAFLATQRAPSVELVGRDDEGRLTIAVDPAAIAVWGYWLSRGGWFGHSHVAIEPTNAPFDSLTELTPQDPACTLSPKESRTWTVTMSVN